MFSVFLLDTFTLQHSKFIITLINFSYPVFALFSCKLAHVSILLQSYLNISEKCVLTAPFPLGSQTQGRLRSVSVLTERGMYCVPEIKVICLLSFYIQGLYLFRNSAFTAHHDEPKSNNSPPLTL